MGKKIANDSCLYAIDPISFHRETKLEWVEIKELYLIVILVSNFSLLKNWNDWTFLIHFAWEKCRQSKLRSWSCEVLSAYNSHWCQPLTRLGPKYFTKNTGEGGLIYSTLLLTWEGMGRSLGEFSTCEAVRFLAQGRNAPLLFLPLMGSIWGDLTFLAESFNFSTNYTRGQQYSNKLSTPRSHGFVHYVKTIDEIR